MNALTKVKAKGSKLLTVMSCAAMAMTMMAVNACAEGEVDISAVTDAMSSSLTDLVGKAALACAGIVGAGLTIFSLKWIVKTLKGFFGKIAG